MANGISIGIAADARDFSTAVKNGVVKPLEDADNAIRDMARDGARLDELADNMQDAQKATSKFDGELKDAIGDMKKASRASRDFGDDSGDGFRKAGRNVEEFKDEARQNFSEVTSSFDGSMDSVIDLAQGTFGGLASSIAGPLGLVAGLGAAALGGIFSSMSTSATENAEKAKQTIEDMFQDMTESGQDFVSQDYVNQKIQEIIGNQDELNKVKEQASRAAISQQTALRAEAGDQDALNIALEAAKEKYAAISERIDTVVKNGGQVSGELRDQSGAAADLVQHYQDLANNQDTAKAKADLYRSATSATAASMGEASKAADGLTMSINAMPKNVTLNVDATTAAAEAKINALKRQYNNGEINIYVTGKTRAGERVF